MLQLFVYDLYTGKKNKQRNKLFLSSYGVRIKILYRVKYVLKKITETLKKVT